jgi:FMN phosphatase YigB (HAD superfamily)
VIYFGDHLLSDLRGPSKAGWRTAAVIRELEVDAFLFTRDIFFTHKALLYEI